MTIRLEEHFMLPHLTIQVINIHVADVWESEDELNKFVKEKLMPAMQQLNVPVPHMEIFQIHNVNAFSGIEKYSMK